MSRRSRSKRKPAGRSATRVSVSLRRIEVAVARVEAELQSHVLDLTARIVRIQRAVEGAQDQPIPVTVLLPR